jgi:hypothetical protein
VSAWAHADEFFAAYRWVLIIVVAGVAAVALVVGIEVYRFVRRP